MSQHTPILFLDFDDVLCLNRPYGGYEAQICVQGRHPRPEEVWALIFDAEATATLRQVFDSTSGIRVVISSNWRECFERDEMVTVLMKTGLAVVAQALEEGERWRTPVGAWKNKRIDDVLAWLHAHHAGEPFAVLDDTYSGNSLRPALHDPSHRLAGRVLLCREGVGLRPEHLSPLLAALRLPASPDSDWSPSPEPVGR